MEEDNYVVTYTNPKGECKNWADSQERHSDPTQAAGQNAQPEAKDQNSTPKKPPSRC